MELWSPEHIKTLIPTTVLMIVAAMILRLVLKDKSHKVRMIPFQILSCVIVIIEIGKQALSLSRGYDLYHLPFHFCSLFIFMLPLMSFYKGKHKNKVYAITTSLTASVFVLMLIYPALIYSASDVTNFFKDFMSFHTVAFHNIVMMEFLLIVFLDLHESADKREMKPIILFILCYNTIAAIMAQLLKTNYNNLYSCNIPPLEALRQTVENAIGRVPSMILYVCIVIVMDVLFVSMSYGLYKLAQMALFAKSNAKNKKSQKFPVI